MGWVKLVLGVGVAAYSYRSVTHVNSLVRQVTVPKYSLLAKHPLAPVNLMRYVDQGFKMMTKWLPGGLAFSGPERQYHIK